jgi:hypothetical protein
MRNEIKGSRGKRAALARGEHKNVRSKDGAQEREALFVQALQRLPDEDLEAVAALINRLARGERRGSAR